MHTLTPPPTRHRIPEKRIAPSKSAMNNSLAIAGPTMNPKP